MNEGLDYLTPTDSQQKAVDRFQYLRWGEFAGWVNGAVASGAAKLVASCSPPQLGKSLHHQIRRVSAFWQVSIVVLKGKDGLLDRVRSRVVGALEFTCKSIAKQPI